jgi:hypothetical protein
LDLGYDGPPFRSDPEHRALIKAELGAYLAYLYALSRDESVSTGNGSGKGLTYLLPIFDAILRDDLARHSVRALNAFRATNWPAYRRGTNNRTGRSAARPLATTVF